LRQLIKNINRFVGQRQYNDETGQREYMEKVSKYMAQLGFGDVTGEQLLAKLPEEKEDHAGNLKTILQSLRAADETQDEPEPDAPDPDQFVQQVHDLMRRAALPLEKPNEHSINQADSDTNTESSTPNDETTE